MKIHLLLFSIFLLLLAIKPCCADSDCQSGTAVRKELAGKAPGQECPGCSPFFTCGSCPGFIIAQPLTVKLAMAAADHQKHCDKYQQPYVETVAFSIWLPPELS